MIVVCHAGNSTLDSGNPLWERLSQDCSKSTTVRCVQKSLFGYLDHALGKDVVITDSFSFRRNGLEGVSENPAADVLLGKSDVDSERTLNTVEDITDNLYGKGVQFFRTHDVQLRLPEFLGGAEIRMSSRSFEDDGATFKITFKEPEEDLKARSNARGVFKKFTREYLE